MPIIIDGWNLIRSDRSTIDDLDRDAALGAEELMLRLGAFQKERGDPIVVVFDSSSGLLETGHKNSPKLSVVAARNADDYIKKFIDKVPERQRRNLKVVSSDKDVFYYAKSAYAMPVKSEDFWDKIEGSA
jgi:predicted RNA-binding protein with PIN domain